MILKFIKKCTKIFKFNISIFSYLIFYSYEVSFVYKKLKINVKKYLKI